MSHKNEETLLDLKAQETQQNSVEADQQSNKTWKRAMIGGVAAIAVGATAVGANALMHSSTPSHSHQGDSPNHNQGTGGHHSSNENATSHHQTPSAPYDHLGFAEAFDAARELVGLGGVFTWHGQLYNTYTEAEWNALSDSEKDAFVDAVTAETNHEPHRVIVPTDSNLDLDSTLDADLTSDSDSTLDADLTPDSDPTPAHVIELDVVLDEGDFPSGEHIAIGQVEGHQAFVIDVDPHLNDGGDIAIIDLNNDSSPDANEVFNVHTGEHLDESTGSQIIAAIQEVVTSTSDHVSVPTVDTHTVDVHDVAQHIPETDIAPDMPDYINDADVDFT